MTVGIVGAGITGLATAYYLRQAGVEATVFEARNRPGGVIRSKHLDGRVLECGPQRGRMSGQLETLVDDLELNDEVITVEGNPPLYVYFDGKLREVPFDPLTFLRTDLFTWRGKLRMLAEPLSDPGNEEEIAADLFTRKFGTEAYENLVGPLFGGIYGSDPAEMYVRYTLKRILAIEERSGSLLKPAIKMLLKRGRAPAFSFDGGMETIPRALYEAVSDDVTLGVTVADVHPNEDGGYALNTSEGSVVVDEVVLTTPADVTASLVVDLDPESASRLVELNYNPLVIVHLQSNLDRPGFGYQIRRDEDFKTLGVTWNANLFDRDGVNTAFLGGMHNPDLIDLPESKLGQIAREEFEAVTGAQATVLNVERLRRGFPAYDRSWRALEGVSLPEGVHLATNFVSGAGIPRRLRQARSLAEELVDSNGAEESRVSQAAHPA